MTVDRRLAIRAALTLAATLAPVFIVLAVTLDRSFFEDWGWLVGPGAWFACAALTARLLHLPVDRTLFAALVAGIPSGIFVAIGLHDVGPIVSLPVFGYLVARTTASAAPAPATTG